jgi:hypothetical protein
VACLHSTVKEIHWLVEAFRCVRSFQSLHFLSVVSDCLILFSHDLRCAKAIARQVQVSDLYW